MVTAPGSKPVQHRPKLKSVVFWFLCFVIYCSRSLFWRLFGSLLGANMGPFLAQPGWGGRCDIHGPKTYKLSTIVMVIMVNSNSCSLLFITLCCYYYYIYYHHPILRGHQGRRRGERRLDRFGDDGDVGIVLRLGRVYTYIWEPEFRGSSSVRFWGRLLPKRPPGLVVWPLSSLRPGTGVHIGLLPKRPPGPKTQRSRGHLGASGGEPFWGYCKPLRLIPRPFSSISTMETPAIWSPFWGSIPVVLEGFYRILRGVRGEGGGVPGAASGLDSC